MSDPLARVRTASNGPPDLFSLLPRPARNSTQTEGQIAADKSRNDRYEQIINLLRERGPLTNWEIADLLKCQPHQTSGRLAELKADRIIENTGERRKKSPDKC